jgi:DNA-directed RNA polymerase specialized sigma24 family protein
MRKYLTQAMVRESIERLEVAARTVEEFETVVDWWDKLDKKIQEAFEKTVWSTDSEKFNWNKHSANIRQADISHILFHCFCQMHNLIEDDDLARLFEKATDKQKEIFFLRVVRGCTPQKIAVCLEMTDRNVRDMENRMIRNIKKGFYIILKKRQDEKILLRKHELEFISKIEQNTGD